MADARDALVLALYGTIVYIMRSFDELRGFRPIWPLSVLLFSMASLAWARRAAR